MTITTIELLLLIAAITVVGLIVRHFVLKEKTPEPPRSFIRRTTEKKIVTKEDKWWKDVCDQILQIYADVEDLKDKMPESPEVQALYEASNKLHWNFNAFEERGPEELGCLINDTIALINSSEECFVALWQDYSEEPARDIKDQIEKLHILINENIEANLGESSKELDV